MIITIHKFDIMKNLYLIFALSVFYTVCAQGYSFKEGSLYYNITSTRDMTVEVTYGDEQYGIKLFYSRICCS